MNKYVHVMVDTETLGLGHDAIIMSIGAVSFTLEGANIFEEFYMEIDPATYIGKCEIDTVKWWIQKSSAMKVPIHGVYHAVDVLKFFNNYLKDLLSPGQELILWCKGTDFDIPKLQHAFKQSVESPAWKYSNVRDCRTVFKTLGIQSTLSYAEVRHNALEDAKDQVATLVRALNLLPKELLKEFQDE